MDIVGVYSAWIWDNSLPEKLNANFCQILQIWNCFSNGFLEIIRGNALEINDLTIAPQYDP
jgi:hypothetical protein